MVRALLTGGKTQTRRALEIQPWQVTTVESGNHIFDFRSDKAELEKIFDMAAMVECCRYGKPGDRLYVRENGWQRPERTAKMMREGADTWAPYYFDADGLTEQDVADFKAWGFKRRPSIHMPRAHSRILLEIVSVRVERLKDISEADALAEGITCENVIVGAANYGGSHHEISEDRYYFDGCPDEGFETGIEAYGALWESINGAGSWDLNPWVWCVEFRRLP